MITKLLFIPGISRAAATNGSAERVVFPRAVVSRGAKESAARAAPRHSPRLRPRLECRWHVDPVTGTLSATWLESSAETRAGPDAETGADRQLRGRWCRPSGRADLWLAA